jgi:uncharacterized coiled-coil DUF342 family protein
MQLEKVTSQSGHAALAGWISSNDVTLFTTVLVMAVAIFLAAKLSRGVEENAQITADRDALANRLDATSGDLKNSTASLNDARKQLDSTREKSVQLQLDLVQKLEAIASLNTKLDALIKEKGQLESQRQSLLAAKDSLSKDKERLSGLQATVIQERDSLDAKNVDLHRQLDSLASKLAEKVAALEQVESERDRLKKQADELEVIVAKLKQQSDKLNVNLADLRTSASETQAKSDHQIAELETKLAARDKTAEDYVAELARAAEELQRLTSEKRALQETISKSELKHQAELLEQGRNNRELVGLTGNLKRVAVLFDASGSMRQKAGDGSDRWSEAQDIAAKWLQHLNVEQCTLIVFSSSVHVFPEDGSLADVRGESGRAKRDALLRQVRAVTPSGGTNTYEALRSAYEHDIDAILLFSDGAPSRSNTGEFDPGAAKQIYELCRAHPNIPIHTVGLGNYFDQNASTFLISVAKITGGTFRGS